MTGFAALLNSPSSLWEFVVGTNAPRTQATTRVMNTAQPGWWRGALGRILSRGRRNVGHDLLPRITLKRGRSDSLVAKMHNITRSKSEQAAQATGVTASLIG